MHLPGIALAATEIKYIICVISMYFYFKYYNLHDLLVT